MVKIVNFKGQNANYDVRFTSQSENKEYHLFK